MERRDKNARTKEKIDPEFLRTKALKRFLCFLYVGKEHSYYKAKPWNDDDFYLQGECMRSLEILASSKMIELVPIDKIKLAMDSKLIQRPETLMFSLAMCARQKKSEKLRAAAYYFLTEHFKEWKYFILFIRYASYLCRNGDATTDKEEKHIGWGRGWKNAVNKWYINHNASDLAILIARHKGAYGWKHKDILKLSHIDIQSLEVEKRVVIKYVLDCLEQTSEEYRDEPEAKQKLDYFKHVEEFRRSKDVNFVIKKIKSSAFTMDHVHPDALKSQKVWSSLLTRRMDIRAVLKYLPKMIQLGLLTETSRETAHVVRILTDKHAILWNKILPADILEVLNFYEEARSMSKPSRGISDVEAAKIKASDVQFATMVPLAYESSALLMSERAEGPILNARKTNTTSVQPSKEPSRIKAPSMRIRDALRGALSVAQTVDITGFSKRSYLIAVKLPTAREKNKCLEAALAIALPLLFHREHADKGAIAIVCYTTQMGVALAEITKYMSYDEALQLLRKIKTENSMHYMPMGPVEWCFAEKKRQYDVVINVTNEPPSENQVHAYKQYCSTRIINVIISRKPFEWKRDIWSETLTINGFDPHVPWIIEAYVRELF